jgi:hypothetical protein
MHELVCHLQADTEFVSAACSELSVACDTGSCALASSVLTC